MIINQRKIDCFINQYEFLSNFYESEVTWEGITYLNSEAAYQSAKTLDINLRLEFSKLNGKEAKKKARKIKIRKDWDEVKLSIMYDIVKCKFNQNVFLKIKLLNTNNLEIIEGNYWRDTFWGVCNDEGENHLGKILMRVRDEIKNDIKNRSFNGGLING